MSPSSVPVQRSHGDPLGRDPAAVADLNDLPIKAVNGAELSLDHGYPARVIVPANPGVHNTKWVASLTFGDLTFNSQLFTD